MDDQQFRTFLKDAKDRANHYSGESYVSADVRTVILDLLKIVTSFERIEAESDGQSADSRIMKRKYDTARQETKLAEKRVEALKKLMTDLLDVVIAIGTETAKMPEDMRAKVKDALQKTAKTINESQKI